MRIGIDCLSVNSSYKGGVNTYVFGLIEGFKLYKDDKNIEFVIFCKSSEQDTFSEFLVNKQFKIVVIDNYHTLIRKILLFSAYVFKSISLWRFLLNKYVEVKKINKVVEENCDILYTPTTILNFYNLTIPTLLSMHDIQQYHYPEFFSSRDLIIRRLTFVNSSQSATFFQASSSFIKDDLLEHFDWLKGNQIEVINEGVNFKEFQTTQVVDIKNKYKLPEKFLFYPAQLWKHKNHITVLKALKQLEEEGILIPLVMTGAQYSSSKAVLNFIEENNMSYVYYLGKVSFTDLKALYQNAHFLITAVLYESSSLPILESAASGRPVIASATPPNIEMAQTLKINLFEPTNVDDCVNTIKTCWNISDNELEMQIHYNRDKIALYSWKNVAKKYIDFIKEVL